MAVAEKKSESMYGLLSAVVKEIKSLRSMFGLGAQSPPAAGSKECPTYETHVKSEPDVIVTVASEPVEREVITLDLNASEPATPPKIVVSDVESDTGSDLEESDESDSYDSDDSDEDEEDENEDQVQHECPLEELNVEDVDVRSPTNSEPLANIEEVDLSEVQEVTNTNVEPELIESTNDELPIPSNDQLRKMNINQLKTIAIQLGITADTSKMKKPELIHLIQAK